MAFFSIFLFLVLLILPIFFVFNPKKKNPNHPPGPPKLPIIGNFHQLGKLDHRSLQELSKKYGPIIYFKFGSVPSVVVSSPELAKEVLKTYDLECCSRPLTEGAGRLSYKYLDVAFTPYGDYWRVIRKISVLELFSSKKVKSFAFIREKRVVSFIDSISHSIPNPVNLTEKAFSLLDGIMCEIACGRSFEGKQFKRKVDYVIHEAMTIAGIFSAADFIPYVGWIIDILTGLHARIEQVFHDFDDFFEKEIFEHLDPHWSVPEPENVIDSLIKLMKNQTGSGGLTQQNIKGLLLNVFLGGVDTSAVTIVWAMTELMKYPRVMKKVQAEIRSFVGKTDKPIVEETVCEKIKYLNLVIKETFRLHPPVVLLIPRRTVRHIKLGGYDIYPNTILQVNTYAIARDPAIWENAEEFYPERFEDEAIDLKGQNFEYLPFGSGRRMCPGLLMGYTIVTFVLGNLLFHFDWELPDGMEREDISMEEEFGLTVQKKIPLHLVPVKHNWQE